MNRTVVMIILGFGLATSVGTASAAGDGNKIEDITMQVMEGEQPQEIIQRIEMPPNANQRHRIQEQERRRELQNEAIDAMQEQKQQMQEMKEQIKDTINDTRDSGMGLLK